jgi:hypothetical protein
MKRVRSRPLLSVAATVPMAGSASDGGQSRSSDGSEMKNDGAGQYIGKPRMPFSKAEASAPPSAASLSLLSRGISPDPVPGSFRRGGLLQGVPQLALAVLVEGDAEADDFEDVLAGAAFARVAALAC